MTEVLTKSFILSPYDTDPFGIWKQQAIFSLMQEIANEQVAGFKISRKDLVERGSVWVIARTRLRMQLYPCIGEEITVSTWAGKPDRICYPRYFTFEKRNGERLGAAVSLWMAINIKTRAFILPGELNLNFPAANLKPPLDMPKKLRLNRPTRQTVFRKPLFSDLDINMHMNNTRYAEWICDLFPPEKFRDYVLSTLQINYVAEAKWNQMLAIDVEEAPDTFIVKATDAQTGRTVFEAQGEWKKK